MDMKSPKLYEDEAQSSKNPKQGVECGESTIDDRTTSGDDQILDGVTSNERPQLKSKAVANQSLK